MLTKTDISKLQDIFVTRDEFRSFKDETFTRLDALMYELKAIREEMAIIVYRQSEHTDLLEDHDTRLVKLEKHT